MKISRHFFTSIIFVEKILESKLKMMKKYRAVYSDQENTVFKFNFNYVWNFFKRRFRIVATLLNTISSSANFILYCLLSPQFLLHLKFLMISPKELERQAKCMGIVTIEMNTLDSKKMYSNSARCRSAVFW